MVWGYLQRKDTITSRASDSKANRFTVYAATPWEYKAAVRTLGLGVGPISLRVPWTRSRCALHLNPTTLPPPLTMLLSGKVLVSADGVAGSPGSQFHDRREAFGWSSVVFIYIPFSRLIHLSSPSPLCRRKWTLGQPTWRGHECGNNFPSAHRSQTRIAWHSRRRHRGVGGETMGNSRR